MRLLIFLIIPFVITQRVPQIPQIPGGNPQGAEALKNLPNLPGLPNFGGQEDSDYDYSNEESSGGSDNREDLAPVDKKKNEQNVNIIVQQFIEGDKNTKVTVTHQQNTNNKNTNIKTSTQIKTTTINKGKGKAKAKKRPQCIPCNNHQQCRRKSRRLTTCYPIKCRGALKGTCGAPWKPPARNVLPKDIPICPKTVVSNGQKICKVRR